MSGKNNFVRSFITDLSNAKQVISQIFNKIDSFYLNFGVEMNASSSDDVSSFLVSKVDVSSVDGLEVGENVLEAGHVTGASTIKIPSLLLNIRFWFTSFSHERQSFGTMKVLINFFKVCRWKGILLF